MTDNNRRSKRTVEASFRVMGEGVEPERVSAILHMSPSYCHRKGDENVLPSGRTLGERSEGIWMIESAADASDDVEAHILSILEQLKGKRDSLQSLQQDGARLDIFVGVFGPDDPVGFSISGDTVTQVGYLRLSIEFDIYTS